MLPQRKKLPQKHKLHKRFITFYILNLKNYFYTEDIQNGY